MVKGKRRKDERHGRKQQKEEKKPNDITPQFHSRAKKAKCDITSRIFPVPPANSFGDLHRKIIRKIVPHREKREFHDRCHELIILLYKTTPETFFLLLLFSVPVTKYISDIT